MEFAMSLQNSDSHENRLGSTDNQLHGATGSPLSGATNIDVQTTEPSPHWHMYSPSQPRARARRNIGGGSTQSCFEWVLRHTNTAKAIWQLS